LIFSKRPISSPNHEAISSVLASLLEKHPQNGRTEDKDN